MPRAKTNQDLTDYIDNPLFKDLDKASDVISAALGIYVPPFVLPSSEATYRTKSFKLSAKQERILFLAYNYTKSQYAASASNGRVNLRDLETTALTIRSKLVHANMALVPDMAKKTGADPSSPEVISEGNSAVLRSVEKFDASRGYKFSTYVCNAIKKALNRLWGDNIKRATRYGTEFDPDHEKFDATADKHDHQFELRLDMLREELVTNSPKSAVFRNPANPIETLVA